MVTIRYTLFSNSQGLKELKTQPKNWNEDTRKLVRSTDSLGILYDHATGVEFTKDGYDFIVDTERVEGFDAKVICRREILGQDLVWKIDYEGELDLTSKKQTKNGYEVEILTGGLTEELKAIYNDSYELARTKDVNDNDIPSIEYERLQINGRNLLVSTLLEGKNLTVTGTQLIQGGGFITDKQFYYVPFLDKTFSGDIDVESVISSPLKPFDNGNQLRPTLNSSHAFLGRATTAGLKEIKVSIDCDIYVDGFTSSIQVIIYRHKYNETTGRLDYLGGSTLTVLQNIAQFSTVTINDTFSTDIYVGIDQYLSLVFYIPVQTGGLGQTNLLWILTQRKINVEILEGTAFASTTGIAITIKKVYERLTLIGTGRSVFKSDYFTSGEFKDAVLCNGKQIRGFDESMEISLKSLDETCSAIFGTSKGIEKINGIERLRVEPINYFFNRTLLLELGRVENVEETYYKDGLYGKVSTGYEKGGDYEENQGLDEYNTKSDFTHNFKKVDKNYNNLSPTRADTIGIELARRKPKKNATDEDTRFDKDNFIIDCYSTPVVVTQGGQVIDRYTLYVNRPYTFNFEQLPTGIFSPETAYNLRLTPRNNLQRVSNYFSWIAAYPDKITQFISGTRNTELSTKLFGQPEIKESDPILNSTLRTPLLLPTQVTFTRKLSPQEFDTLIGSTDGTPNWYKMLSFIDDRGNLGFGFLLEYEPTNEGKLTLLKVNL